ncbi:MAG: tRNA 2-thiouridine(34) synthase MnmA, partial [Acidimicrobiia bacterium]
MDHSPRGCRAGGQDRARRAGGPGMKVVVAMSGGVDSSVAAALMSEAGHEVIGVTLKQWEDADGNLPTAGCCTVGDAEDARRVAAQLDIPYYVLDYVDEFRAAVVEPFGSSYLAGRTPNPCVECNRTVRFQALLERTAELGADVLATGHYARVVPGSDGHTLRRGVDPGKDQSYVLHMLTQDQLARIQLPVGELTKPEVRDHAARLGLRTAGKPDSQEICFVGAGNYRDFLAEHFPETARPGPIVDMAGTVVGSHGGTAGFTVGQRRGLGVAFQDPRIVVEIDAAASTVVIGDRHDLLAGGCEVRDVSFVSGRPPTDPAIEVKVRYRSRPVPARLE